MEQDYKKSWNTLKAESGGRWCQPHPLSNELLTIGELMRNMERRASETAELAASDSQQTKVMPCLCTHRDLEGMRYDLQIVKECPQHGHFRKE